MQDTLKPPVIKGLKFEEGCKLNVYLCSNGYPTIGVGRKIGPKCDQDELEHYYGEMKLTQPVADLMLSDDIDEAFSSMMMHGAISAAFGKCDTQARRFVLLSMAFQMGPSRLSGFKKTLRYITDGDWVNASEEMLDSVWYREDSPSRAKRHSTMMLTGHFPACYKIC